MSDPKESPTHQCGWCPTLLPDDPDEWAHHHFVAHGQAGWSVRPIQCGGWDVGELVTTAAKRLGEAGSKNASKEGGIDV